MAKLVDEVRAGMAEADARRCRELLAIGLRDEKSVRRPGGRRRLTSWEFVFAESLSEQIASGVRLTPVQRKKLAEVHERVCGAASRQGSRDQGIEGSRGEAT